LYQRVEPHHPKAGNGYPPIGLERILRIYFLRQWFNLSSPRVEEALCESISMREFVGIDLGLKSAPSETIVCKFRHLPEKHELGRRVFEEVGRHLMSKGMKKVSGESTIVDATIIAVPSSRKNSSGERDPEMRQTKKGNPWHFGMKGHIGVDRKTKLIHSAIVTPANVHDSQPLHQLLHGSETRVWSDFRRTLDKRR